MYINKFNLEKDAETISAFIEQHNFGILVSGGNPTLEATHLPFELIKNQSAALFLRGHMAKANQQWKHLSSVTEVLVIFQGPNTYISPRWYDHINVPTMNYIAVHVYGKPRIIEDSQEIYDMLKKQIEMYEKEHTDQYNIESLPSRFLQSEMKALVGLEIKIDRVEASFKLSQNRDEKNYKNIITELEKRDDPHAEAIATEMKRVLTNKGYKK